MNNLIVSVDLDWACEPAIEETLDFLNDLNIQPIVFITHQSPRVEAAMDKIDVGLHPYFNSNSSHGSTIQGVVNHVMDLPHNFRAFRCHRFATCNSSKQALVDAGMLISSNVCTDLEVISPFKDRFGLLEIPVFLEDGGYLWRKHPLKIDQHLSDTLLNPGIKVIIIHPMHFSINTPNFSYMQNIKRGITSQKEWRYMSKRTLNKLRWHGYGIRDFLVELLKVGPKASSLSELYPFGIKTVVK
jgi:hypothetical protein